MADLSTMPTYELNHFARWLAEMTEAYFENPDVKRRYEEWEKEQESKDLQEGKVRRRSRFIKLLGVFAIAIVLLGGMPKVAGSPNGYDTYIVERGDTVSGIALEITPDDKDHRETVYMIIEKNGIENGMIYPGQELQVPVWEVK